jgi:hypothetical protein
MNKIFLVNSLSSPDPAFFIFDSLKYPILLIIALLSLLVIPKYNFSSENQNINNNFIAFYFAIISSSLSMFLNFFPDDSFAHFRVVKILSDYSQYSYNLNYFVEGTATPLWHLILLIPEKLGFHTPSFARVINIIFVFFALRGAIQIFKSIHKNFTIKTIFIFLSLISFNPIFFAYITSGMETILYLTLYIYFLKSLLNNKLKQIIIFSTLLILCRFDGALIITITYATFFIFNLFQYKNIRKHIYIFLYIFILFFCIGLLRFFYFGDFFPHVVNMKSSGSDILRPLLYYSIPFFINMGFIFYFLSNNLIKSLYQFKKNLIFIVLLLIGLSFTVIVLIGGGDWMPFSRYLILPFFIFILIASYNQNSYIFKFKVAIPLVIWVLFSGFIPNLNFLSDYGSTSSQYSFTKLLNKDGRYLSISGNTLNKIFSDKNFSIYTRWIGYIPFAVGSNKVYDELCYFYKWNDDEFMSFTKRKKIGHLIEATSIIKKYEPDFITNISSNLPPNGFSLREYSYDEIIKTQFNLNKLDNELKSFINDKYETIFIGEKLKNSEKLYGFFILKNKSLKL